MCVFDTVQAQTCVLQNLLLSVPCTFFDFYSLWAMLFECGKSCELKFSLDSKIKSCDHFLS